MRSDAFVPRVDGVTVLHEEIDAEDWASDVSYQELVLEVCPAKVERDRVGAERADRRAVSRHQRRAGRASEVSGRSREHTEISSRVHEIVALRSRITQRESFWLLNWADGKVSLATLTLRRGASVWRARVTWRDGLGEGEFNGQPCRFLAPADE